MMLRNLWERIRKNHAVMMLLCCVLPLAIFAAGITLFGSNAWYLPWFALLLCVLLHAVMMKGMHTDRKTKAGNLEKKEGKGCHQASGHL